MCENKKPVIHYANTFQINIGPYDAVLRVGLKKDRDSADTIHDDFDTEIYLSHQLLKVLAEMAKQAAETIDNRFAHTSIKIQAE